MEGGVPQHLEHRDVVGLGARLLEHVTRLRDDYRVCRDDESGIAERGGVERGAVDGDGLLGGRLEDIFEGGEGLGEVLGEGGGDDLEVLQTYLFGRWGIF